ncbi:MAG: biotin/lipoyl-binding protein [Phycisphaeraceae bacterium]|nr:MAG: biotin/lipoyl-binding protein [Phycisphaeraceae bacterium]
MKLRVTIENRVYEVDVEVLDAEQSASHPQPSQQSTQKAPSPPPPSGGGKSTDVNSPVAGTIVGVKVKVGDSVDAGATLMVLEAMKMESNISAPAAGTVRELLVAQGDLVKSGQTLARLG